MKVRLVDESAAIWMNHWELTKSMLNKMHASIVVLGQEIVQ